MIILPSKPVLRVDEHGRLVEYQRITPIIKEKPVFSNSRISYNSETTIVKTNDDEKILKIKEKNDNQGIIDPETRSYVGKTPHWRKRMAGSKHINIKLTIPENILTPVKAKGVNISKTVSDLLYSWLNNSKTEIKEPIEQKPKMSYAELTNKILEMQRKEESEEEL